MKKSQCDGSATSMVIIVLLLAGMLLTSARRLLTTSVTLIADEQEYLVSFYQAQSALNWGATLTWPEVSQRWFCQTENRYQWHVCLKKSSSGRGLMRGMASGSTLMLWQWVSIRQGHSIAQPGGWIDFCPLTRREECLSDEP